MNCIDQKFQELMKKIKGYSEAELYYQMRTSFEKVPLETKVSMMNFFNDFLYWGRMNIEESCYEEIEWKAKSLKEHLSDFEKLYELLSDYRSKKTLYAILNNWVCFDFLTLEQVREKAFDDYFDLDLVPECNQEVMVDLGAYTGDTILSFANNYGKDSYQKIYAYEITADTFTILEDNVKDLERVECRLKGVGNENCTMNLIHNAVSSSANTLISDDTGSIPVVSLDSDICEEITMIKADIEGFEQKALEGAKEHIKNEHPKLFISVYHNNEDLFKIPQMIQEIDSTYQFYLRYYGGNIYPTEITLIAI